MTIASLVQRLHSLGGKVWLNDKRLVNMTWSKRNPEARNIVRRLKRRLPSVRQFLAEQMQRCETERLRARWSCRSECSHCDPVWLGLQWKSQPACSVCAGTGEGCASCHGYGISLN
jgi:hypothetical protein